MSVNSPSRGRINIDEISSYDAATQVRTVQLYLSCDSAVDFQKIEYKLRVIFPQELLLLLESTGFTLIDRFGEFTREPFTAAARDKWLCVHEIYPSASRTTRWKEALQLGP